MIPYHVSYRVNYAFIDPVRCHLGSVAAWSLRIVCATAAYADAKRLHRFGQFNAFSDMFYSRNLKGGIGSLFDSCVNAMGWRPYCPSRMEVSYCTFGFGAIIRRDLCTLSLPRDSPRAITNMRAWFESTRERQLTLNEISRLSYEKIRRYNNSPPYVTARWPSQQIPPLNFLGFTA